MKFRPSHTCCGCVSLLVGVEGICLLALIECITIVAISSSEEQLQVAGVIIRPWIQILAAAWSFVGIPVAISAGVGALYRIEANLRVFFAYLGVSFIFGMLLPLSLLTTGSICNTMVAPEVQKMGSSFVCGFSDTMVFFWTCIGGFIHLYIMYIVWSAAEEIIETPYPELMKYSDALKGVYLPGPPPGQNPVGQPRAVGIPGQPAAVRSSQYGAPGYGAAPFMPRPGEVSEQRTMPLYNGMPNEPTWNMSSGGYPGTQQSFIPGPPMR